MARKRPKKKAKRKLPTTPQQWVRDIDDALADAAEAIPFGPMAGGEITPADLFQLAPHVCIKFRGLRVTDKERDRVVRVALANYVVSLEAGALADGTEVAGVPALKTNPRLAFALCYVSAHLALDLVDEAQVAQILDNYEASWPEG